MKDLHQDWRGRKQAIAEMAGVRGERRAVTATQLVELIRAEVLDLGVLNGALQTLIALGSSALPRLQPLLDSHNTEVRQAAAVILGQLEPPLGAPLLLGLLEDADTNVRYHAIEALGQQQALAASQRLLEIAEGSDSFLAFAAGEALQQIADPAAGTVFVQPLAPDAFGAEEPETLARQLASVDARTRLDHIRRGLRGPLPREVLTELLDSESEAVRGAAARWLAAAGEVPEGWRDFSPRVRCEVLEEVSDLNELLRFLPYPAEGLVVLRRLTEWPAQPDLEFPERDDLWWNVYLCRLMGAWKLRPEWLEDRLDDLRPPVRAEAVRALALIKSSTRIGSLLLDSELDVAESALQALALSGDWERVRDALDEPRLRSFAFEVLAGSPHREDLEDLPVSLLLSSGNPGAYSVLLERVEQLSRAHCEQFREIVRGGWRPAQLPVRGRRWLPLIFQDAPEVLQELLHDPDEWVRRGARQLLS